MMKKVVRTLAVTVALCGAVRMAPASAQDLGGALDLGQLGTSMAVSQAVIAHSQSSTGKVRPRPAPKGSTRFRPSQATRKRTIAAYVARTRAHDAKSGAELERALAKSDPIAAVKPAFARFGLRTDDVADAMAAYLVSAWYGVRGSNQDPPRGHLRATREQMHRALLSTPKFAKASNAVKQNLAESMILETAMIEAAIVGAKGKPELMARVKSGIRQTALNTFQLDMAKLKLTGSGLRS